MNLVAKEYVAAQDPNDPGVLILSRFAGAAAECQQTLLVNPYDPESVAAAIARALNMPLSERRERYSAMLATVARNGSRVWSTRFLESLGAKQLLEGARAKNGGGELAPASARPTAPPRNRHGVTLTNTK